MVELVLFVQTFVLLKFLKQRSQSQLIHIYLNMIYFNNKFFSLKFIFFYLNLNSLFEKYWVYNHFLIKIRNEKQYNSMF